jgi:hypothetical protein
MNFRKKESVIRIVFSMIAEDRSSSARRSDTWMVARATRSLSPASIITTCAPPQSSARNSVCPGCAMPATFSPSFVMGQVTTASDRPARTSAAAARMYSTMARDPAGVLLPKGTSPGAREDRGRIAIRPGPISCPGATGTNRASGATSAAARRSMPSSP